MKQKTRDKTLRVNVNEDEWNIIQKRLEVCKVSLMSELFRHVMLHGIYLKYGHEELKKYGSRLQMQQIISTRLHTE